MAKKETAPKATKTSTKKTTTASKATKTTTKTATKSATKPATKTVKASTKASAEKAPKIVEAPKTVEAPKAVAKTPVAAPKAVVKAPVAAPKIVAKASAVKAVATKKAEKKVTGKPAGHGVGRRKKSTARVWLRKGKGAIVVNSRPFEEYFDTEITRLAASTPLRFVKEAQEYDIEANIYGGGLWGQADALKLGIARALVSINDGLRPELRKLGLLTVDARVKERKKYGQKAARRKFQFVKR